MKKMVVRDETSKPLQQGCSSPAWTGWKRLDQMILVVLSRLVFYDSMIPAPALRASSSPLGGGGDQITCATTSSRHQFGLAPVS